MSASANTLKRKCADATNDPSICAERPPSKRRKINPKETDGSTWSCTQCTFDNCATNAKCAICLAVQPDCKDESHEASLFSQTSADWDDNDELQIDANLECVPYEKLAHESNPNSSDGVQYYDCWICTNCHAMNRLLDTLSKYNMLCAYCYAKTYTPATPIVQSFDWDAKMQSLHVVSNSDNSESKQSIIPHHVMMKRTKNKEGDLLVLGMLHQSETSGLSGIKIVSDEVVRLILLFHGSFDFDGFDSFTNQKEFELDNGLTTCRRTKYKRDQWCNVFGMREAFSVGCDVCFKWVLSVNKTRNKDWIPPQIDTVIIGVIDAAGIQSNMSCAFTQYKDGWGVLGIGQKVADGSYVAVKNVAFKRNRPVSVSLAWVGSASDGPQDCRLQFGDQVVFHLPPQNKYRLAAAMKCTDYELEWVSFGTHEDVKRNDTERKYICKA